MLFCVFKSLTVQKYSNQSCESWKYSSPSYESWKYLVVNPTNTLTRVVNPELSKEHTNNVRSYDSHPLRLSYAEVVKS